MIFTIDSDDEVPLEIDEEEEKKVEIIPATKTKKSKGGKKKEEPAFHFEFDAGDIAPLPSRKKKAQDNTSDQSDDDESDIDEDRVKVIDKKAPKLRKQDKNSKMEEEVDAEEDFGMDDDDEKEFFDEVIDTTSKGKKLSNNNGNQYESDIIFAQLNLSRPFLRAIEAMGYTTPTPIQTQVIPHALAGRDICASAVTGSGKTAAFLLPALERLLYRPKDIPAIRVLVITPTRELATQIYDVLQKLSQFTDITSLLICGGNKDVRSQEAQLKQEPDIVICTPGRMLDHLRNSLSITLDYLNILILDEVDRLLELGFQEEVEELIKYCPYQRQTMLFSATMTPKIEDLIKLSLKKPLRIKTDSSKITIASRLIQEFIKLKNISESLTAMNNSSMATPARKNFFEQQKEKEAILLALIHRSFHTRTIVFFELKKNAQRFCALLNLSGIKAVELHGDLPQIQRYMSLESFRTGEVEVLVATDVAARGIDISQVQTVINAEMPRNISIYIHRVGRTARAGCGGRSITLVSEDRRKIMKEVLKEEAKKIAAQRLAAEEEEQKNGNKTNKNNNKNEKEEKKKEVKKQKKSDDDDNDDDDNDDDDNDDEEEEEEEEKDQWDDDDDKEKKNGFSTNQILSRNVPSNVVQHYLDKINNLEPSLANYLQEERHRRQIDQLEREAERAQNILLHQDEIQSRPARTWFQTETQKQQLRTLSKERIRSEREALSNPRKRTLSQGEEGDEGDNDSDDDDGEEEDHLMLESERKLKELSTADDYRIDENDKSNKKLLQHRLSRKKRRRLEALEASREADEEGDEGQSNRKSTPAASVKQVKQQQREKQREKLGVAGKSAGELTMKKVTVVEAPVKRVNDGEDDDGEYLNRAKGKKRTKVVRQTFAYGGLDQDIYESSTSSRLSKKKAVKNEAEDWKEFDPTKRLKKGGKAGTASFKSKKKYKRRK